MPAVQGEGVAALGYGFMGWGQQVGKAADETADDFYGGALSGRA